MKKSALALAVAAALTGFGSAAYADTTLYGSARVSVDYDDFDTTYRSDINGAPLFNPVTGRYEVLVQGLNAWDVFNNTSRLGVRGEEDLGGGLAPSTSTNSASISPRVATGTATARSGSV